MSIFVFESVLMVGRIVSMIFGIFWCRCVIRLPDFGSNHPGSSILTKLQVVVKYLVRATVLAPIYLINTFVVPCLYSYFEF